MGGRSGQSPELLSRERFSAQKRRWHERKPAAVELRPELRSHAVFRPANQPAVAPTTPPTASSPALRRGLRFALEASPRAECRTVAFVAFLPILRPSVDIDASRGWVRRRLHLLPVWRFSWSIRVIAKWLARSRHDALGARWRGEEHFRHQKPLILKRLLDISYAHI